MNKDLLTIEKYFIRASKAKRLLNYAIDLILFFILFVGVGIFLTTITPAADEFVESDSFILITVIIYAIYMSLIEAAFKGKSFAKLFTRTRAANLDGSTISLSTAFARGFSRAIPFCVLSAFGTPCNPWHDRWTNTIVIDEIESEISEVT